jgi:SAM-dependent methyltransferase
VSERPTTSDATQRFSDRVADYAAHRPRYPQAVYDFLGRRLGPGRGAVVADVGSGTGIFCQPLLDRGCVVYGVEPNAAMREEAERTLSPRYPSFHSVAGTAEATTLANHSVDLVVAAQAFHWFDAPRAAAECRRVLRPGSSAAMVWNTRKTDSSPFLRAYEELLGEYGTDYAAVRHDRNEAGRLAQFFPHGHERVTFPNAQHLDLGRLRGRLLSSSYTPAAGDPRRPKMLAALDRLFDQHQHAGTVTIDYDTELYHGVL